MAVCAVIVTAAVCALIWNSWASAERNIHTVLNTVLMDAESAASGPAARQSLANWLDEHGRGLESAGLAAALKSSDGSVIRQTQTSVPSWPNPGRDWRAVSIESRSERLIIGRAWQPIASRLRSQACLIALLGILTVVITGIVSWALIGRMLSPIRLLSRQAQAASTDNLNLHLEAPTQDIEVMELVTTLNGLLTRLSDTAASRGRFYSAASHELRTPLQALSGHLELALNRDRDAAEYRALLEEARIQTKRLTTLARDLLYLNRLETGAVPACEPVEVSELCERLLTHFQPLAARRQLSPHISLIEEAVIQAPPLHVEMLTRNLIENAVKYASPGGFVAVSLAERSGQFCLEVFNSFPSYPRLDSQEVFEPFFRPDASRNMETGGNGLGLALCQALTNANRWRFEWRHDDDGIRAMVWFPAESTATSEI